MSSYSYHHQSNYSHSAADTNAKNLQERLHELLSRISDTTDLIKSWPESDGDDASIHVKTTSKLIGRIGDIVKAIKRVEGVAKQDEELWKRLKDCAIPLDLLDLLDHAGGLNPEMFSRGLLREALSQLAGLRRRKVALDMLGNMISAGLAKRNELMEKKKTKEDSPEKASATDGGGTKRKRAGDDKGGDEEKPSAKKSTVEE